MNTNPTIDGYNAHAQEWAQRMRSGKNSAHEFLEKPAMYAKLPDLTGKSVLCIGCGSGEECEYLKSKGASRVVGIDLSEGLIEVAKKSYPDIEFLVMDLQDINFNEEEFDFVYSSLAMHYLEVWTPTLSKVRTLLKPAGTFLFSTHHPVFWGMQKERNGDSVTRRLGYKKVTPSDYEIYGNYFSRRKETDVWFGNMQVSYYHKSLSEIFAEIRESRLELSSFIEPKSTDEAKEVDAYFYNLHQKLPIFMIFELTKS